MPSRKEPKETVVYPSSKRKAPPFKPQRPSKTTRIPTTESESSLGPTAKRATATAARKPVRPQILDDDDENDDEDEVEAATASAKPGAEATDSDEELALDPLSVKPKPKPEPKKPAKPPPATKRKASTREVSPMSISSHASTPPPTIAPPVPSQSGDTPHIPQNLLIRLLHEDFADKGTKIDKHATHVLQKYMEVFVREAIARTALAKKEAAEKGDVSKEDAGWLELEDLEQVAPGLVLDF